MLVVLSAGFVSKYEDYLVRLRWNSFNNRMQLLASGDSLYQNIVIAGNNKEYGIFTDGQLTGSYPDEYLAAHKAHLFLSQHPAPERVLLIGGGLTGLIRNILQHPVKILDYIELDSAMTRMVMPILAIEDQKVFSDQRVHIMYTDGRRFVKSAQGKYDLIIVNAPEPATAALNRFYTVEFYREIKKIMAENGVMVTGLPVFTNYEGGIVSDYAASLYHGLQTIFPCTLVIPQDQGIFFFAAKKPNITTSDYQVLKTRYQKRGINSTLFTSELFRILVQKQRIASVTVALSRRFNAGINSDLQPITYFYQLLLWEAISGSSTEAGFFQAAGRCMMVWIVSALIIVCFLYGIIVRCLSSRNALYVNCLWVIGVAGCTGMVLELVLIFMLQNMYGYIYQMIGIIAGSFMFGLTAGGYSIIKLSAWRNLCGIRALLFCEIALCLYAVLLPFALQGLRVLSESLHTPVIDATAVCFMVLVGSAGFITGMLFPLVSNILVVKDSRTGIVAGRVDAADHFGACAGSFLAGTLLVPLAGVYQTCFIMGFLNASGAFFLMLQIRMDKS
jgi:spermidine synthase